MKTSKQKVKYLNNIAKFYALNAFNIALLFLPEEHTTGPSALARAPRLRSIPITVPF